MPWEGWTPQALAVQKNSCALWPLPPWVWMLLNVAILGVGRGGAGSTGGRGAALGAWQRQPTPGVLRAECRSASSVLKNSKLVEPQRISALGVLPPKYWVCCMQRSLASWVRVWRGLMLSASHTHVCACVCVCLGTWACVPGLPLQARRSKDPAAPGVRLPGPVWDAEEASPYLRRDRSALVSTCAYALRPRKGRLWVELSRSLLARAPLDAAGKAPSKRSPPPKRLVTGEDAAGVGALLADRRTAPAQDRDWGGLDFAWGKPPLWTRSQCSPRPARLCFLEPAQGGSRPRGSPA